MLDNDFKAAISPTELLAGETRHAETEQSRKLAMAAGLTKSCDELEQAWQQDPSLYLTTLNGAIAAYNENKNIEELLVGCIARLASVVDKDREEVESAMSIIRDAAINQAS